MSQLGAVIGITLGVAGGIIGTAAELRRAKSTGERRYLIKAAIVFSVLIGIACAALALAPAPYRTWIWVIYAMMLPLMILAANRGHARARSDNHPLSTDDG
jgi:hypothetical protein